MTKERKIKELNDKIESLKRQIAAIEAKELVGDTVSGAYLEQSEFAGRADMWIKPEECPEYIWRVALQSKSEYRASRRTTIVEGSREYCKEKLSVVIDDLLKLEKELADEPETRE